MSRVGLRGEFFIGGGEHLSCAVAALAVVEDPEVFEDRVSALAV